MILKVWTHNGDYLLFETQISSYWDFTNHYEPHLLNVLAEIWDNDTLLHEITL